MGVQIVELGNEKHALIPIAEYNQLLVELEDRDDERFAKTAEERRVVGEEYLPIEMVDSLLAGESALRVWRKHRGLKQLELAALSGVTAKSVISKEASEMPHSKHGSDLLRLCGLISTILFQKSMARP
jgi:DNA-binding XRE family transcriptional regulator